MNKNDKLNAESFWVLSLSLAGIKTGKNLV